MKPRKRIFILLYILLVHISCINFGMDKDKNMHTRMGFAPEYREYKFNNPENTNELITSFSLNELDRKEFNYSSSKWRIEYFIHTTYEEAEIAAVERMELSNIYLKNAIDYPLTQHKIGDNCWHLLKVGSIMFIRNNTLVLLTPEFNVAFDSSEVEQLAYQIDSILISKYKVTDSSFVGTPLVESSELISEPPFALNDRVEFKITVKNNLNQKCYFRINGTGLSSISYDGYFNVKLSDYLLFEKEERKYLRIWIWNEEFKITSSLLEIPL